jgi:hypothetical protein
VRWPAAHFFFLLLYLASSYTTTQHRTADVVRRVEHSNSRSDLPALFDAGGERVHYTRFREAKKACPDIHCGSDPTPMFFVVVTTRKFAAQNISLKQQFDVGVSQSRAPPQTLTLSK